MDRLLQVLLAALLVTAVFAITLEELDDIVKNNELCSLTECVGPYTKEECPQNTRWMDNVFVDGCCGGCVSFQQDDEECTGKIDCRCCLTTDEEEVGSDYGLCNPPTSDLMCSNCTANSSLKRAKNSRKTSFMSEAAKAASFRSRFLRSLVRSDNATSDKNILYSLWCDYGLYCTDQGCQREYDWVTCINTQESYDRDIGGADSYVAYRDDYRYRPDCDAEEIYFAPKQCKSSSFDSTKVCVCVDSQGNTIDGKAFSFQGTLFDDMNCLCSRRRYELQQSGDVTTTLHCQTNGNYEELQCEDDWCYCVHPNNGTVYGYQMPEPAINLLPCFNRTLIGDQYLRQCESREHAHNVFINTMTEKGVLVVPSAPVTCTIDGSYAARHCDGSSCSCFSKYNKDCIIDGIGGCACMTDKLVYDEYDKSYTGLTCEGLTGYYSDVQEFSGQQAVYLVDSDGIRVSSVVAEACEDNLQSSNYARCQVVGNLEIDEDNDGLTFCEAGCIANSITSTPCDPSMYLFNTDEYVTSSECV